MNNLRVFRVVLGEKDNNFECFIGKMSFATKKHGFSFFKDGFHG